MSQAEGTEDFVKGVVSQTWSVFCKDPVTYVVASLVVTALSIISLGIVAGPLFVGYLDMIRRGVRGESVSLGDLFSGFDRFVPSFIAFLLVSIAVFVGCLFLILPGLAVLLFTMFTLPAIAYEGAGAIAAVQRSVALVQANFVNTLTIAIVIAIAQSIGGAVLLGVLLTTPLSLIALSVAYFRVAGASEATDALAQAARY